MTEDTEGEATADLVVFKCETCGDVFPSHETPSPACPSCGGTKVHQAHEPLL